MSKPFDDLRHTLDQLYENGQTARFWLRDDDAEVPSAALEKLIDMTDEQGVPCLLAVIPAKTGQALAQRLESAPHIDVAVHGWAHQNYALPTEKKQELGSHRPLQVVLGDASQGLGVLQALYGNRCVPLMVPPWNRIDAEVVKGLYDIGYSGLSVFGPEEPGRLARLNTHFDLIDWRGTRGGREDTALVHDLKNALAAGIPDIGFLTHHLVHDAQAWRFLNQFLALSANHPACIWRAASNILHDRAGLA